MVITLVVALVVILIVVAVVLAPLVTVVFVAVVVVVVVVVVVGVVVRSKLVLRLLFVRSPDQLRVISRISSLLISQISTDQPDQY